MRSSAVRSSRSPEPDGAAPALGGGSPGGGEDGRAGALRSFEPEEVAELLARTVVFASWSKADLLRLAANVFERNLRAGEVLFDPTTRADHLYWIARGRLRLSSPQAEVDTGVIGAEAATELGHYLGCARAESDCTLLGIPRFVLTRAGGERGSSSFFDSLLRRFARSAGGDSEDPAPLGSVARAGSQSKPQSTVRPTGAAAPAAGADSPLSVALVCLGWAMAIAVPGWLLSHPLSFLDYNQHNCLGMLALGLVLLTFNLVPQYAAAMISVLGMLLLDVAPAPVLLGGFGTGGLFMVLGIFGVGSVLVRSGIVTRLVLLVMRSTPHGSRWYDLSTMLVGLILTPCIPSANTRVQVLTPIISQLSRSLGYADRGRDSTRLVLSMLAGASIFAPVFLTSKSLTLLVHGMLPDQVAEQFQWLGWVEVTALAGGLLAVGYFAIISLLLPGRARPAFSKKRIEAQLHLLGPLSGQEKMALASVAFYIFALVSYSVHKISPYWITLGALLIFLLLRVMDDRDVEQDIDWSALLIVGFFTGTDQALDATGLSAILARSLSPFAQYMTLDFETFTLILIGVTALLRLVLPITTAGVLLASTFIPLAVMHGVSPWIVGFVILMFSECWVGPTQCSYFQTMEAFAGARPVYDRALLLRVNLVVTGMRIAAVFALLPYFRWLGVL